MKVTNLAQYRREKEKRERQRRRQTEALRKAHRSGRQPANPFNTRAVGQGGSRDARRLRRMVEGPGLRDALPYLGVLFLLSLLLAFVWR